MTNTNDPLPAIQVDELGIGAALPVLMDTDDDAGEDECYTMTLAHLVAVLAALTPEQLDHLAPYLRPRLTWTSNGEAGDGQNVCSLCDVETDEPHTLEECKQAIASSIDHGWSVVGAAMDETEKEKARADRAERELSEIRAKSETVVHTDDACGLVYFINRDNPQAFWRRKNA